MHKLILGVTLSFFLSTNFAFADKGNTSLESIAAIISKKDNVKTDFVQIKHLKKINKDFKGTGVLIFAKKLGIIWQTLSPVKTLYVLTDKQITQVNNNKIQKIDASNNALFSKFSRILQAVFAGNSSELSNNFTYAITDENGETKLTLIPKDQNVKGVIASIELRLRDYLTEFSIFEPNGDSTRYMLQNISSPYELTPSEQQFFVQ